MEALTGEPIHRTVQLQQLAALPSLTSISLLDRTCPTQFLNVLSPRLTALHLDASYHQLAKPAWQATLSHVARCTALQSLTIPCVTSEELGVVAPALQRLRRLHLNGPGRRVDGDAVVERLLGLPHLTSLRWDNPSWQKLHHSHASSPCHWQELSLGYIRPHQLARLPLHSLTSPISWANITVDQHTSVAEVQAVVDNVARRCPAGGAWRPRKRTWPTLQFFPPPGSALFARGAGEGDTPAALLRALQPLLAAPGLDTLAIMGLAWDVELVKVLGQVVPRRCTALCLYGGTAALPACVQLAKSLPWLQELLLTRMAIQPPQAVTAYVGAATSLPDALLPGGRPRLTKVNVCRAARREGVDEEAHRERWEEAREAVESLGVECTVEW